ncbi:MAG: PqiC family protein, partial [Gammaproteobacteria bacterium]|nr:PqiC family protein [Gammaproteobacteria bacterium]
MIRRTLLLCVALLSACAILPGGKPAASRNTYLLESRWSSSSVEANPGCQVVVVNPPENAPGHSGGQMLYQRNPNQIERFAFSRWAASPAVMIEPLLLDALRSA